MRDPYNNTQTRFDSTGRGRWSPIYENDIPEPWWMAVLGGVAIGGVLALMLYLAI